MVSVDSLTDDRPDAAVDDGMCPIAGGRFAMGSDRFYPEEAPVRRVTVGPFRIDRTPVTNAAFARFVAATGHVTAAEIAPDPVDYPGMAPGLARAGSAVFHKPPGPVPLSDPQAWWRFTVGADWRHPTGPDSTIAGLEDHPVVHVAHADALAYARWAGKDLPTEAEWEFAARGGLGGADYAWGRELAPGGAMLANYWQGLFPFANQLLDGWERTSPVGSFPANGHGLYDMIGNVWEWTRDDYDTPRKVSGKLVRKPIQSDDCCGGNAAAGRVRKVVKGGSYLCAENYCRRFRPAARHPETAETSTGHIGFRCVRR